MITQVLISEHVLPQGVVNLPSPRPPCIGRCIGDGESMVPSEEATGYTAQLSRSERIHTSEDSPFTEEEK